MAESVPSILESEARGEIADIYADIRKVLGTSVVNLIWRNLATMPGALEWTWSTVRPLYLGDAPLHAEAVRQTIALPDWPGFSTDTLLAAGVDETERALIRATAPCDFGISTCRVRKAFRRFSNPKQAVRSPISMPTFERFSAPAWST